MLNKVTKTWCIQISLGLQLQLHGTKFVARTISYQSKSDTIFIFNNFDYEIAPFRLTLLRVCHPDKGVVTSAL